MPAPAGARATCGGGGGALLGLALLQTLRIAGTSTGLPPRRSRAARPHKHAAPRNVHLVEPGVVSLKAVDGDERPAQAHQVGRHGQQQARQAEPLPPAPLRGRAAAGHAGHGRIQGVQAQDQQHQPALAGDVRWHCTAFDEAVPRATRPALEGAGQEQERAHLHSRSRARKPRARLQGPIHRRRRCCSSASRRRRGLRPGGGGGSP